MKSTRNIFTTATTCGILSRGTSYLLSLEFALSDVIDIVGFAGWEGLVSTNSFPLLGVQWQVPVQHVDLMFSTAVTFLTMWRGDLKVCLQSLLLCH